MVNIQAARDLLGYRTVHRVRMVAQSLTTAATDNIGLLAAADSPDSDLETDGTNVAQCENGSRIVAMKLKLQVRLSNASERTEMFLFRDQDNAVSTNFTPTNLFDADHSVTNDNVRKNLAWYDVFIAGVSHDIYKKRISWMPAMSRMRQLRDTDRLELNFVNSAMSGGTFNLIGTITSVV